MKKIWVALLFFTSIIMLAQNKVTAVEFQNNLNKEFADPDKSPLTEDDLAVFKTLDFFPVNTEFIVEAKLTKSNSEKAFAMKTTTDRTPMYVKYGTISFTLKGENYTLNVYRNLELSRRPGFKNHLFLPFSDLTSGEETYIGGRYIDLEIPKGDVIVIDFNKAYNPYCAYNYKYSCPIVPLENDLAIKIEAGVKNFLD